MASLQKITPFLWFDHQAEEAVNYYTSIFRKSKIVTTSRYSEEVSAVSGQPKGSVMTIAFQLEGQDFVAINGGPVFKFNPAVSFVINCTDQKEVDYYWDKLTQGGDPKAQQCGWLQDKFGVSWQVVPVALGELMNDPNPERGRRAMKALLAMKKLDIAALKRAADGG